MRTIDSLGMKRVDKQAFLRFGIPPVILMENAGRSASELAHSMLGSNKKKIWVFCGYGNNGGDGFVAARHLLNKSIQAEVFLVGRRKALSLESRINYNILKNIGCKVRMIRSLRMLQILKPKNVGLVVDAVFGVGLRGNLDDFYIELFKWLNDLKIPVLSLDIPSGLDADKGRPLPLAIKAKRTITFGLVKRGLLLKTAKPFVGKLKVADISLPLKLTKRFS